MMHFPRTILQLIGARSRGRFLPSVYRLIATTTCLVLPGLSLATCVAGAEQKPGSYPSARALNPEGIPVTGPVHLQAENISFQVIPHVRIAVKTIDALMLPTHAHRPVSLDDPKSLRVQIQAAQASISAESLTTLLNDYTLPHANTAIHDLTVTFEDGDVHVKGKLKKLVEIPFSAVGHVQVTHEGDLRLHLTTVTAMGFVHKKVLDWLGLSVASVAGAGKPHSFRVVDDDLIFPLHMLFPAPHFSGDLRSVNIEGNALVQTFGTPKPFAPAPVPEEHYLYFRGGTMEFGRLRMQGVELELVNKEHGGPLNFSMNHAFEEALPGYLKSLPNRGVIAYIASWPVDK